VGGLNSLGQPNSARRANFQKLGNETCPGIFCWILESGWNSWGFLPGRFESPPALLPPGFDAIIFFLLGWTAAMKLPRIPATFKDPANPSNFLSAAEEIPQNPSKLPTKNRVEKFALTIEHFHNSSKQKRAIKNFPFVVNFSSSEFEIGCQVLFLTSGITHKIRDKNSQGFEQLSAQE
jgi:hypothetical protein